MSGPQGNGSQGGGGQQGGGQGGGRRRGQRRRKPDQGGQDSVDLWRRVPDLEPVDPILPVDEAAATAMLRSLGAPPLPGQGQASELLLDLSKVVYRASQLATALADAAGILDDGSGDETDETDEDDVPDDDGEAGHIS
jgi:hypothetical protein